MISVFMQLIPDWAPNVHPILVHFPIAIFFFAAFMDLISFVLPERWWGGRKTAITYLIGAIFVVIVYFTGKMAADSIHILKMAYRAVGEHAGWAFWTVWFFGIYGVLRFVLSFIERLRGAGLHIIMFLISLVGLYFLYETGEHGGKLVFGYGLGTGQLVEQQVPQQMEPQKPGFHRQENGDINWVVGDSASHVLTKYFTFLEGDAQSVNSSLVSENGNKSAFAVKDPHFFFVTDSASYADVEIELAVNPKQYKGDIVVAHNVRDADNYAYMVLHPDGTAQLGRYVNGAKSAIKKGSFKWQGLKHLKLAVSGNHIRGYVNNNEILHGHSDQNRPGAVGLKLEGRGAFELSTFKISKISAEKYEHGDGR